MITWVTDLNPSDDEHNRLKSACDACEVEFEYCLAHEIYDKYNRYPEHGRWFHPDRSKYIFKGTIYGQRQWDRTQEGISYCEWINLKWSEYITRYPREHVLNNNYYIVPLGELGRRSFKTLQKEFGGPQVFIRPNDGYKPFTGQLLDLSDHKKVDALVGAHSPSLLVVLAKPRKILEEYRLVICNKQVIAASQYMFGEEIRLGKRVPDRILAFGNNMIAESNWEPETIYTMDIATVDIGGWEKPHLLELNSFSTAGLYECDYYQVVQSVSAQALKDMKEYYGVE